MARPVCLQDQRAESTAKFTMQKVKLPLCAPGCFLYGTADPRGFLSLDSVHGWYRARMALIQV
jgi:hypothetical protein